MNESAGCKAQLVFGLHCIISPLPLPAPAGTWWACVRDLGLSYTLPQTGATAAEIYPSTDLAVRSLKSRCHGAALPPKVLGKNPPPRPASGGPGVPGRAAASLQGLPPCHTPPAVSPLCLCRKPPSLFTGTPAMDAGPSTRQGALGLRALARLLMQRPHAPARSESQAPGWTPGRVSRSHRPLLQRLVLQDSTK